MFLTHLTFILCLVSLSYSDLNDPIEFSDTNHGNTNSHPEHLIFIDHGNGAVSSIRRSVLSSQPPFSPHVNDYPKSLFGPILPPTSSINSRNDKITNSELTHTLLPVSLPLSNQEESVEPFNNYFTGDLQRLTRRSEQSNQEKTPKPNIPPKPIGLPPTPLDIPFIGPQSFSPLFPVNPLAPIDILNPINSPVNYRQPNNRPVEDNQIDQPVNNHNPIDNHISNQIDPSSYFQPGFPRNEFFPFFDSPLIPINRPIAPNTFQRRRLTIHNNINNINGLNDNSLGYGYPSYTYYKGDDDAATKWPKIFKFTDGRVNLKDFERDKKQGRIKFNNKEDYFEDIKRDSFLILHGGAYNY